MQFFILILALVVVCASGFRVSQQRRAGSTTKQHALVEKFSLLDGREVRVFDGKRAFFRFFVP
jgi:hypothetical protein